MRTYLAGILLIGTLAGCSSDWDPARTQVSAERDAAAVQKASGLHPPMAQAVDHVAGAASLPDRGELLRYAPDVQVRRSGAYTHHPVEISEAHALNAMQTGELKLNSPDGKLLSIDFDGIEEYEDGNWSWFGHGEDGSRAVLTFGKDAVFGDVMSGDQSFRITTAGGRTWLVATDATRVTGQHVGRHDNDADYLIAPALGLEPQPLAAMAASVSQPVPKAAAAAVDVALGYSDGLVAAYRSEQAAVTRLTHLVSVTNAAYQRSGVSMRIRLVATVRVAHPDNTDNADVLRKLTGYNEATETFVTPDPAFNALRTARETYGADLVSFVRPHLPDDQKGCGIAWLIGANGRVISAADAPFGYSVVSDGFGTGRDGHEYYCSEYALAHEMAHNMGQAHDEANVQRDSQNRPITGVHAYSYGYRESSSTGFFTIMAYPLSDTQREVGNFANPAVMEATTGRPTGVVGTSNNALSLNQTMPVVSAFRETKVPVGRVDYDFNGDSRSDILWRNQAGGNAIWLAGNSATQQPVSSVGTQWTVKGVGDFNGDGKSDILWRNSSGNNAIWLSGNASTQQHVSSLGTQWAVVGVGDFNGDGRADVLWRSGSGGNAIWLGGSATTQQPVTSVAVHWFVAGVGDFNGDGKSDILWRNTSGNNTIWLSGSASTQRHVSSLPVQWSVAGVGDFNGDGRADILWRNTSGNNAIWLSGDATTPQGVSSVGVHWSVASVGDFNGDGRSDILWRNTTGANTIWLSGNAATQRAVSSVAPHWSVVGN